MTTTPTPVPTTPGLYLDAVGEVWRVRDPDQPCRPVTFDELLEQAILQPAEQAARSGPFTPLLALTDARRFLIIDALLELQVTANSGEYRRHQGSDIAGACEELVTELEALA